MTERILRPTVSKISFIIFTITLSLQSDSGEMELLKVYYTAPRMAVYLGFVKSSGRSKYLESDLLIQTTSEKLRSGIPRFKRENILERDCII